MTDALSGHEFAEALEEDANDLLDRARDRTAAGEYENTMQAVLEEAEDMLRHSNWFARDYYGESLYGSIIEHSTANPSVFSDWEVACAEVSPKKAVKELAYYCYEAEVVSMAQEQV